MPQHEEQFDIAIRHDGTWLHRGAPIRRKRLVRLFSTVLKKDADGVYWLETPAEKGRVDVEDAPFIATGLEISGEGRAQKLEFTTNLGDKVTAGPDHPVFMRADAVTGRDAPYVIVRDGLEARLSRPVYYELAARCVEAPGENPGDDAILGIWSQNSFFELG